MKTVSTIDEISTEIASGIACAKSQAVADGVLHLRPFSVTNDGRLVTADAPRIPHSIVPSNRMNFEEGDILFNNTNSVELVGKSAVISTALEASFSNHMTRVRIDRRAAEPGYVQAFLRHLYSRRFFQDRATRWVSQAAFGTAQLKALEIPLPPVDEQRRIVALLDRAAEIRRRAEAARANARAIIPALFHDAFGDPATNPKRWRVVDLGEILDRIDGGWSPRCGDDLPAAAPQWGVLKLSAVKWDGFNADEAKLLPGEFEPRPEIEVQDGDLLFTRKNTIDLVGTAAIARHPPPRRMLPDTVFRLVPSTPPAVDREYLCGLINLSGFRLAIRALASGSASSMPGISKGRLKGLRVPLPPYDKQVTFAEQLQRLDLVVGAINSAAVKAEAMAASLSAEIFEP